MGVAGALAEESRPTVKGELESKSDGTTTLTVPFGNETRRIRYRVVSYCNGLGLDLGCGGEKIVHTAIGIDKDPQSVANLRMDFSDLRIFSDGAFDFVYSSHALEDVYYKEPILREWWRVIKPNGYLVIAIPDWEVYKRIPEFNVSHSNETVETRDIRRILDKFCFGDVVKEEKFDRSSVLIVKKLGMQLKGRLKKKVKTLPEKSAMLVRYGAFGDGIVATPVLKKLKQEGYYIVLNCSDYCAPVFKHNPNIDELIVHQRDSVPNDQRQLEEYWEYLSGNYSKFVNLSGSMEGSLLLLEGVHPMGCDKHKTAYSIGCRECETAHEARDGNIGKINYYDRALALAGFPECTGQNGELFFSHGEMFRARDLARKWRRKHQFVVIWSLTGSSYHKAYPYWATAAIEFCRKHPDVLIYSVGDELAKLAEFETHPRVIPRSAKWSIRESMIMTQFADLVIGGETGVMHAAACYETPKVVILSHSSKDNLTKYWKNCTTLEPDRAQAPCYPCHQLHYSKESCPLKPFPSIIHLSWDEPPFIQPPPNDESQHWPICQTHGIAIDRLLGAMDYWYEQRNSNRRKPGMA